MYLDSQIVVGVEFIDVIGSDILKIVEGINLIVLLTSICSDVVIVSVVILPTDLQGRVVPAVGNHLESINKAKGNLVASDGSFIVDGCSKFSWSESNSEVCSPIFFSGFKSNFV